MSYRTALILETNPVITERYLKYLNDSNWRIMLKDTLNEFLEKLQHEQFNLIVAEESLLPQSLIRMIGSIGIPFILSTNSKKQGIPVLPRNFNRTELLTVFERLVPNIVDEPETQNTTEENSAQDLFSELEDEEETFELTSDAVILNPEKTPDEEIGIEENDPSLTLFEERETPATPFDEPETEPFDEPETEEELPHEEETIVENTYTDLSDSIATELPDDALKVAVTKWLEKNARSIIKEIVLEQLASLSGKNND